MQNGYSPTNGGFYTVAFPEDCQNGMVVGEEGWIDRTSDGGAHWVGSPIGCEQPLLRTALSSRLHLGLGRGRARCHHLDVRWRGGIEESPKPQAPSPRPLTTIVRGCWCSAQ